MYGLPEQMPVERELLASGFQVTLGRSSSFLVHNLAMLGRRVGFVTQVGRDELGNSALDRLREGGVDLSQVTYREHVGTGVTVLLQQSDRGHILTYRGAIAKMTVADLDMDITARSLNPAGFDEPDIRLGQGSQAAHLF